MTTKQVDRAFARYCREGDPEALATVFDGCAAELLRLASHFARDAAEAEDFVQETFLRAIERAATFRRGERVVPWLLAILVNVARSGHRRRRRDATHEPPEPVVDADPGARAHDKEVRERIEHAVGGLPEPYRGVVERHLVHGKSGTEIGRELARSPNTVRSQLRRGLDMLRTALPAGFAAACARPEPNTAALASIRDVVIRHAGTLPAPSAAAASGAALGWLGVWMMSKKVTLAVAALVIALAFGVWSAMNDGSTGPAIVNATERSTVAPSDAPEEPAVPTPAAPDAARRTVADAPDESGPDETFRAALARMTGRVVESDTAPIPDARVALYAIDTADLSNRAEPSFLAGTTTTDELGRFAFDELLPGTALLLRVEHDDRTRIAVVQRAASPGASFDVGDIAMHRPTVLTGRVVDPDGEPLADVEVFAIDVPPLVFSMLPIHRLSAADEHLILRDETPRVARVPSWARAMIRDTAFRTARTGADGAFELRGVQPGGNAVFARVDGLAPSVTSVVAIAGKSTDAGAVRMLDGRDVRVRVVDALGRPVEAADVLVASTNGAIPIDVPAALEPTDGDGRTRATGIEPGRVTVAARRSAGRRWVVAPPAIPAREIEIPLPPVDDVTVNVRDAHGARVAGAEVAFRVHRTGLPVFGHEEQETFATDESGAVVVPAIEHGAWTVRVTAPGFATAVLEADVGAGTVVDAVLEHAREALVIVRTKDGTPVRHARVLWSSDGGDAASGRFTDAAGHAVFEHATHDRATVTASHPAFGRRAVEAGRGDGPVTITLPGTGALEIAVTPPPAPDTPAALRPKFTVDAADSTLGEPARMISVDADGRAHVSGLTPGEYHVREVPSLADVSSIGSAMQHFLVAAAHSAEEPRYTVVAAETTHVVLDGPRADIETPPRSDELVSVTGAVFVDGQAPRHTRMMAFQGQVHSALIDDAGRFSFETLGTGRVQFALVQSRAGESVTLWNKRLTFEQHANHLRIDLRTGAMTGAILDANGQGVPGAPLQLAGRLAADPAAKANFHVTTDENGTFTIDGLPEGEYTLDVRTPEGSASRDGVTVSAAATTSDVVIRIDG